MPSALDLPERCTVQEAAVLLAEVASDLAVPGDTPSVRTLRLWRTKRLLSLGDRRMTRKNLLEALAITRLGAEGMSTAVAAERSRALDEHRLVRFLSGDDGIGVSSGSGTPPEVTLRLLAQGLLAQYRAVSEQGAIVGHVDAQRQHTPPSLRRAMALLGRLFFEEGRPETTASVHALLRQATTPLHDWAPAPLRQLPNAADLVLIDPDYLVPSEDCELIAEEAEGTSPDDLLERHLHGRLTEALGRLGADADRAYTAIRQFIGRHPLATRAELRLLKTDDPDWPDEAIAFIESVYVPIHAADADRGEVSRCRFCKGLIDRDGRCMLRGCREEHAPSEIGERLPADQAFIARPEVLKYWVDPARSELRLYDTLAEAGLDPQLYPHSDRCDVSLGEEIGVDVKDYADPVRLARKLNRGIGGLAHYPRAILAIADRRARTGDYRDRLREQLTPGTRRRLEIRSVTDTIRALTGAPVRRRGGHAR